ncbi:MAG: serine/threonine protein kinase [Okeania sp. SIO3I5]|uniref:AAA-like domain-containing protein n=1 Tax=Okeania sp. SIO3I5 TaxID=2607805 RepID=UPI0013B9000C|nr:AAA-like domain-containing protein [Okeania sp. SIO3I5]NEQ35802.1 serine/threonine protein kinase [Okeania sp. SIO3I5]
MNSEVEFTDIAEKLADKYVFEKTGKYLSDVEKKVLQGALEGKTYEKIAQECGYATNTLNRDYGKKLWDKLSEALGERVSKTNFREALKRKWEEQELSEISSYSEGKKEIYIERQPIEYICYETILQPGALIPIKAPSKMGKTLLLNKIVNYTRQKKYYTVKLDFLKLPKEKFKDLDIFMQCFCAYIQKDLPDNLPRITENWNDVTGNTISATNYLEAVMENLENPLLLALDNVDKLFDYPDIYQDFLPLLRSWHEEANTIYVWEKLRLIVVHSTEDYGRLDLNKSPFNVEALIELRDFNQEEIKNWAQQVRLNLTNDEINSLMEKVGGHPDLIKLAFDKLVRQEVTLTKLLEDAATDAGIYERHLRRHLNILNGNSELKAAFKEVVNAKESVQIDSIQSHKLYSMGLITREGNKVMPRYLLYRIYFQEHL